MVDEVAEAHPEAGEALATVVVGVADEGSVAAAEVAVEEDSHGDLEAVVSRGVEAVVVVDEGLAVVGVAAVIKQLLLRVFNGPRIAGYHDHGTGVYGVGFRIFCFLYMCFGGWHI